MFTAQSVRILIHIDRYFSISEEDAVDIYMARRFLIHLAQHQPFYTQRDFDINYKEPEAVSSKLKEIEDKLSAIAPDM